MSKTLDTAKLSGMLKSKRGNKGLRAVAIEIGGVSAPTLSRIEQGNLPDIDTYLKICKWLEVSADFFAIEDRTENSLQNQVIAHLRADRTLSPETAEALIQMINIAYKSVKETNK
jgi:transcriptional regulator with XRE-family HTH domain